jgi:hypothetical protein
MKLISWKAVLAIVLVICSTVIYYTQIHIFHKHEETFFLMFQDLGFVPIHVLLVTLILDQLFKKRERLAINRKLNMVIGAFFSETGTPLLKMLPEFDTRDGEINNVLKLRTDWKDADFAQAAKVVCAHDFAINAAVGDIEGLKKFLSHKRAFLLGLLENGNLLEHESFTNLLWAVHHLTEELIQRQGFADAPEADMQHLSGDIKRAYVLLITEWLSYNRHLRDDYPYIYSLVVRTNPFDPDAKAEVR